MAQDYLEEVIDRHGDDEDSFMTEEGCLQKRQSHIYNDQQ